MNAGDANPLAEVTKVPAQGQQGETEITLGLLNAVQENSALTQRNLARHLGIALGLANAYLKRCVKKGLIKVRHIPSNRYAYYLTPHGFAEKSRLTAEYLTQSFNLFRIARRQYGELFETCAENRWRRVVLWGAGDLAEIVTLCAPDYPVELVGLIDETGAKTSFMGLPVAREIGALAGAEAVIVTDLTNSQAAFDAAALAFPRERVLAPPLLNIARLPPRLAE